MISSSEDNSKKLVSKDNLKNKINNLNQCDNCVDISIKKFSPLKDVIDFNSLDNSYKRCVCGKRPLDIVMAHILKIMIEEGIVPENGNLRKDTPTPLPTVFYPLNNSQFIGEDSVILIHPNFNEKIALKLVNEVDEVRGVLKGDPRETVGILNKDSDISNYELLAGSDIRSDIINTYIQDSDELNKIIINKEQSKIYIEVASTTETKLLKLYNYLKNEEFEGDLSKLKVMDATCGAGACAIFLLKYGFKNLILNDIYSEAINTTLKNLKTNGFNYGCVENSEEIAIGENFKVFNMAFEDLALKFSEKEFDLCIVDCFLNTDSTSIEEAASKISKNVLII